MAEPIFATVHQAIGAFFCAFSALEGELAETVKTIFQLQQHEAADTIIAALEDFARKTRLVRGAVGMAKNADGSQTSEQWKAAADETMKKILGCNTDRALLAHSVLEPTEDGSAVKITRLHLPEGVLKTRVEIWPKTMLETKTEEIRKLTCELRTVRSDLSTFRIPLPNLGWLVLDTPYRRTPLVAAVAAASETTQWPPDQKL